MTKPSVTLRIRYCVPCNYLPRAAWTATELLASFADYIETLELQPGTNGDFEFFIDGAPVYSKQETGRFPELSEIVDPVARVLSGPVR